MHKNNQHLFDCITLAWQCRAECQEILFHHCLPTGGKHAEPEHVRIMIDCIEICQTAADFMTRSSSQHAATCAACAEVCDACALSCEKIGGEEMKRCAALCRRCARCCREMGKGRRAA